MAHVVAGGDGGKKASTPEYILRHVFPESKRHEASSDIAVTISDAELPLNDDATEEDSCFAAVNWWDLATYTIGLALIAITLCLRVTDFKDYPNAWRWTSICVCLLLSRVCIYVLIEATVYLLENILPLDKLAYFVNSLVHPLKDLFSFAAVAVVWSILFKGHNYVYFKHNDLEKALVLIGLILLTRVLSLLIVKVITAKLHASTFWDQLQTTVKHEILLKRLNGLPIRPRPKAKTSNRSRGFSQSSPKSARRKSHNNQQNQQQFQSMVTDMLENPNSLPRASGSESGNLAHAGNAKPLDATDEHLVAVGECTWNEGGAMNFQNSPSADLSLQSMSKAIRHVRKGSSFLYGRVLPSGQRHKSSAYSAFYQNKSGGKRRKQRLGAGTETSEGPELDKMASRLFKRVRRAGKSIGETVVIVDFLWSRP